MLVIFINSSSRLAAVPVKVQTLGLDTLRDHGLVMPDPSMTLLVSKGVWLHLHVLLDAENSVKQSLFLPSMIANDSNPMSG